MSERTIGMISPFPPKGEQTVEFSALAGYTKTLLSCFRYSDKDKIVVLAQRNSKKKEFFGNLENYKVSYVWRYNTPLCFIDIISEIIRDNIKFVHLQHEVFVFGRNQYIYPYLNILLLLILRLLGVKIVTTVHAVLLLNSIDSKFSSSNRISAPPFLTKIGLKIMYKGICNFSNEVIVHNEKLKKTLQSDYGIKEEKITVIPHPLYKYEFSSDKLKNAVGGLLKETDKVVLFFGFLAPYKGLDLLIKSATSKEMIKSGIYFLIIGSTPKRYSEDVEYISWLDSLKEKSKINTKIIWLHKYIPDKEIGKYFKIADLVVIPYSEAMSASGPLSIAVYYEKPVLVSETFKDVVNRNLIYGTSEKDLCVAINKFFKDRNYKSIIVSAVSKQRKLWSDERIFNLTESVYKNLFNTNDKNGKTTTYIFN